MIANGCNSIQLDFENRISILHPGIGALCHGLDGVVTVKVQVAIFQNIPEQAVIQPAGGNAVVGNAPVQRTAVILLPALPVPFVAVANIGVSFDACEGILRNCGRRTVKVDVFYCAAAAEGLRTDGGHIFSDGDVLQLCEVRESIVAHIRQAVHADIGDHIRILAPGIAAGFHIAHGPVASKEQIAVVHQAPGHTAPQSAAGQFHIDIVPVQVAAVAVGLIRPAVCMSAGVGRISGDAGKCILCDGGCRTLKPDRTERRAAGEGLAANPGNGVGNRNIFQSGKVLKGMVANTGEACQIHSVDLSCIGMPGSCFRGCKIGHIAAAADAQIAGRVHIPEDSAITQSTLFHQLAIALHGPGQVAAVALSGFGSIGGIVSGVGCSSRDPRKGIRRDRGHITAEADIHQCAAAAEGSRADGGDFLAKIDAFQRRVTVKGILRYIVCITHAHVFDLVPVGIPGIAGGITLAFQGAAAQKLKRSPLIHGPAEGAIDTLVRIGIHAVPVHPAAEAAFINSIPGGILIIIIGFDSRQATERIPAQRRTAAEEIDLLQAGIVKGIVADGSYTGRNHDNLQCAATAESSIADGLQGIGQDHIFQCRMAMKSQTGNRGDAFPDHNSLNLL